MKGSQVDTQIRRRGRVAPHRHRPEVRVVHRLRDAERVRELDRPYRLIPCVHSVAGTTRASVGEGQEHVITIGSRDIFAVIVRIRKMQARPPLSLQYKEVEDRGSQPVLPRLGVDRRCRDHSSRAKPVSLY